MFVCTGKARREVVPSYSANAKGKGINSVEFLNSHALVEKVGMSVTNRVISGEHASKVNIVQLRRIHNTQTQLALGVLDDDLFRGSLADVPEGLTPEIVFEVILLVSTARETRKQSGFVEPV